jgi:CheY-like chemotaxis protein
MITTDEEKRVGQESSESNNRRELQHAVAARGDPTSDISAATRFLRVLVIDDYHDAADCLALMVGMWGNTVKTAYDALTGLEIASTYDPDIVMLDIGMPGMDGCEMARELRRRTNQCYIVAITGYGDDKHRDDCRAAGIDLLLVKPVKAVILKSLLALEGDYVAWKPR